MNTVGPELVDDDEEQVRVVAREGRENGGMLLRV